VGSSLEVCELLRKCKPASIVVEEYTDLGCPQADPPQNQPASTPISSMALALKSPATMLGRNAAEFEGTEYRTTGELDVPFPSPIETEKFAVRELLAP